MGAIDIVSLHLWAASPDGSAKRGDEEIYF